MVRTRIKFCGITRSDDLAVAADAGADAVGLVFYEASPRAVTREQAAALLRHKPAWVTAVGLFVNADAKEVQATLDAVPLECLQFHGTESAEYCDQFDVPWMKAIAVAPDENVAEKTAGYATASAILLDTFKPGLPGGTGEHFDWSLIPDKLPVPLVLAGGLTPDDVEQAIRTVRPYAVDVSGGIESSPGCKSAEKMKRFAAAVRAADAGN
ncbi:MAG: phosphoribosylanthranilate isomerase [Pseudomonadota bacterium]